MPDALDDAGDKFTFFPSYYEICVIGRLSQEGASWFEDMTLIVNEKITPPQTIIHGYIVDQAALYGLISRIRDLGLTLVSVKHREETENDAQILEEDTYENDDIEGQQSTGNS